MPVPSLVPYAELRQPMPQAPASFDGTVAELVEEVMAQVLPTVEAVREFHARFQAHLDKPDPCFVIRQLADLKRGQWCRTDGGHRVLPGDNAPPWWIHALLFHGAWPDVPMDEALADLPTHFHEVPAVEHCSAAGWHLAHLLGVKDGGTAWRSWDSRELVRRTARNLHPVNHFFVPKAEWRRVGADPDVQAYVAWFYRHRYRATWAEFLSLAGGRAPRPRRAAGRTRLALSESGERSPATSGRRVVAMHFVCRDDLHVTDRGDGTFETGVWKIAEQHADSVETVALHRDKTSRSYRHGRVLSWYPVEHEGHQRIVFVVRQEGPPLAWAGGGSGEKGYRWTES